MMSRNHLQTATVLAWALLLCAWGCPSQAGDRNGQGPLVGKPAPPFSVQGVYHEPLALEAFKGHILVLQFGASW